MYRNVTGKKKIIIDRDEMESVMMHEFKKEFTEVYDTPIFHEPFLSIIGEDGLLPDADKVLLGINVLPPYIHSNILEVFEALKMVNMHKLVINNDTVSITHFIRPLITNS